jgi:hypothetical protein
VRRIARKRNLDVDLRVLFGKPGGKIEAKWHHNQGCIRAWDGISCITVVFNVGLLLVMELCMKLPLIHVVTSKCMVTQNCTKIQLFRPALFNLRYTYPRGYAKTC